MLDNHYIHVYTLQYSLLKVIFIIIITSAHLHSKLSPVLRMFPHKSYTRLRHTHPTHDTSMYVVLKFCERCAQIASPFTSGILHVTITYSVLGTNISSGVLFPKTAKLEACLCKNSFCGEAVIITYSKCVICNLSYPACNAHASCYNVTYGLSVCTKFSHIIS